MIQSLRLQHFRSYTDKTFQFQEGANIVVGPNATGKTNLLEAVLVAARGSSYRVKDADLIQFEADWARLDAKVGESLRVVKIQAQNGLKKSFEIDGKPLARLMQNRMLPVVLFEPDHLLLLSGSPDLRRTFLDDLIEQMDPSFGPIRKHYKRVVTQRNALLKKQPPHLEQQLFVWNVRTSELGGQIARKRYELIQRCNDQASGLYGHLADKASTIGLAYASKFDPDTYETALLRKLEQNIELEAIRGYTLYGPHRDDLTVSINGHPAQETASRGEVRTLVLMLKIMELQLLEEARGEKPLLLLDDVFSELDVRRRRALTEFVQTHQTFITTTDADAVTTAFEGYSCAPSLISTL